MTVELEAGGRRRAVDVRRAGEGWVVTAEGHDHFVDLTPISGRWSLLLRPVRAGHVDRDEIGQPSKSYEFVVESRQPYALMVTVNGQPVAVTVDGAHSTRSRRRHREASAAGPRQILAPMPGRIVRVLVQPGDVVSLGQGLVVVEAMKMENELRAPATGTVRAVHVTTGSAVEANSVLMEIE